ncbi:hypothetical protein ACFLQG_01760 [Candidatus Zixiibacteriota bacterium]
MHIKCLTIVTFIALASAVMAADSPIDKGSLLLDGSVYYQSQTGELWDDNEDVGVTTVGFGSVGIGAISLEVTPTVGYFVANGVCIGAQIGFQSISFGDDDKINIFAVGPSLGYYVKTNPSSTDVKGSVYIYGRGYVTFGSLRDENDDGTDITQYGANVGLIYLVSSAVGADLSMKIQKDSWKDKDASEAETGTTIRFGVGLTAFIF